jgi:hypothetical protein
MQDCCLGFIPYCFCSISEKWSISSYFMWDFNSADTCSIACISARVSRGRSSKILGCGFGTIDVPVPEELCIFATGGVCSIDWLADGDGWCEFNWLQNRQLIQKRLQYLRRIHLWNYWLPYHHLVDRLLRWWSYMSHCIRRGQDRLHWCWLL